MPYIKRWWRTEATRRVPIDDGQFNYAVTKLIDEYLQDKGISYTTINEVIGVLECAKLELYRRIAAPYEDGKMAENGDVYTVKP